MKYVNKMDMKLFLLLFVELWRCQDEWRKWVFWLHVIIFQIVVNPERSFESFFMDQITIPSQFGDDKMDRCQQG